MRALKILALVGLTAASAGAQAGTVPVIRETTYFDFQVDSQARLVPGTANPKYPEAHKTAKVQGEVLAQFVVDTTGLVIPQTVKFLKGTDSLFVQSVRDALAEMRFKPAMVRQQPVRQLVQLPFAFNTK
jgi:protein TonB